MKKNKSLIVWLSYKAEVVVILHSNMKVSYTDIESSWINGANCDKVVMESKVLIG